MPNRVMFAKFAKIVRLRSVEHQAALDATQHINARSVRMGILRQELDSLVRVMYLLRQNFEDRNIFVSQTLNGKRWRNPQGGYITDREMVDLASELQGWSRYVYQFGCAFIHLSNLHSESDVAVSELITDDESRAIRYYVRQYHSVNLDHTFTISDIDPLVNQIFKKIKSNMEYYLEALENEEKGDV